MRTHGLRNRDESGGWASLLAVALIVGGVYTTFARAEDAPEPPPAPPLERLFQPVKEAMKDLPPFLRDTDLKIHFRTYYFNRENPNETINEAWAFGGWVSMYSAEWQATQFACAFA